MDEFDDSTPVNAVPGGIPEGERLIWQGRPDLKSFVIRAFHIRKIALYFAILMAWRFATDLIDGLAVAQATQSALWVLPLAAIALGLLFGFAWLVRRSTIYTVTTRRVILRHGVALPKTVTIPINLVESVDLKVAGDGSGDIAFAVSSDHRMSFVMLWPHARPWHLSQPQAAFRAVPDAQSVAAAMVDALNGAAAPAAGARPTAERDGTGDHGTLAPAAG